MHRYGNVPVVEKTRLNWPPGAIGPDPHDPSLAVESCVAVSLFIHVIVVPADTSIGFGAYAVVVRLLAPLTIDTLAACPDGVGEGDGDEGSVEDELPQPIVNPSSRAAPAIRRVMRLPP